MPPHNDVVGVLYTCEQTPSFLRRRHIRLPLLWGLELRLRSTPLLLGCLSVDYIPPPGVSYLGDVPGGRGHLLLLCDHFLPPGKAVWLEPPPPAQLCGMVFVSEATAGSCGVMESQLLGG